MRMQLTKELVSIVSIGLLASACTTAPKVRVDKDANTNFATYQSFAWFTPTPTPTAAAKAEAPADSKQPSTQSTDTLVEMRVRNAVAAVLLAKGYVQNDATPEFRVSYVANIYDRPKQSGLRIGVGAGGSSGHVGGGVGMSIPVGKRTETIVSMTLDVIDVSRNAQVWTGTYEQRIKGPTLTDTDAQTLVSIILEKYPARATN